MALKIEHRHHNFFLKTSSLTSNFCPNKLSRFKTFFLLDMTSSRRRRRRMLRWTWTRTSSPHKEGAAWKLRLPVISAAALPPLDLTEDNVRQVLADARIEFEQIFDSSVGITGEAELAEVDGPFVKISLRGRFWHERAMVLARLGNYLKQRIPEILEVDIEDEKQLDDSPENF